MSVCFDQSTFNQKAIEFLEISKKLNDTWRIEGKGENIYLMKKLLISVDEDSSFNQQLKEIFSIEYHVIFHVSYQVPVLYFNAYRDNGSLVNYEDVNKIFMKDYEQEDYKHEIHKIISQGEHPILFRPFYMIHPCQIHEVLSKFPESKNFILTFLTLYGPSLRLKINSEYEKFYSEQKKPF